MMKTVLFFLISAHSYVFAADAKEGFPTPGFYRIDMESKQIHHSGKPVTIDSKTDGATGDTNTTFKTKDTAKSLAMKGDRQVTFCRKASTSDEQVVIPESLKCKDVVITRSANTVVTTASCSYADLRTTVTKVDDKTWDFVTEMSRTQGQIMGGMNNPDGMRMVLENQVKNGATAEAREQAKQALATLPKSKPAATAAAPAGKSAGPKAMEVFSKARWTRIADTCPTDKK